MWMSVCTLPLWTKRDEVQSHDDSHHLQKMADVVAGAAQAVVELAAQASRTISFDEARNQIWAAIQMTQSEFTLVQTD